MAASRDSFLGRPLHILVVDDEASVLEVARRRLEGDGYRVTTTRSANALDSAIGTSCPDLILMDVIMPDLSARQLAALLEKSGAEPAAGVILHSSIPVRTLQHAVDISKAAGVVQKTSSDVEFFFAFNGVLDRWQPAGALPLSASFPAASGTHRIVPGERQGHAATEHWFLRTSRARG